MTPSPNNFADPIRVNIQGYSGDAEDPFISPDGSYLFFDNRRANGPNPDVNLFYAQRIDDTTFVLRGQIAGANSTSLDAVPTMDSSNSFYFVSTRSYAQSLSTIYKGTFVDGSLTGISLVQG
ncbi:MAG: hypothetical protein ACRD1G_19590, partial [Acidimicrobiales bacterium]